MCIHNDWLDPATCSTCVNGPRITRAKKFRPDKPSLKLDPVAHRMELYLSGAWCPKCDTPVHRGLCQCQREERFERTSLQVRAWGHRVASQAATPRQATGLRLLAHGAVGREISRAGFGDETADGVNLTRRQSLMADDRRSHGVEPKWSATQTTKADERDLPLPA